MASRRITVLYFAAARERAGVTREQIELSTAEGTVEALLAELTARHPALGPLVPHLRVAVAQTFSPLTAPVPDGAEVALIPPVAGG